MKSLRTNNSGFSLAILALLLILGLAVITGYIVIKGQDNSRSELGIPIDSVEWVEYCDDVEKICFSYPSNWLTDENQETLYDIGKNSASTSLENGESILMYRSGILNGINKLVDVCQSIEGSTQIIDRTELSGASGVYFIEYIFKSDSTDKVHMALIGENYCPGVSEETSNFVAFGESGEVYSTKVTSFKSKTHKEQYVLFYSLSYITERDQEVARRILKSFHYKEQP